MKPKEILFLVGRCEGGHRVEMRIDGEGALPDDNLQELVRLGVLCPHCKKKFTSADIEKRKPS